MITGEMQELQKRNQETFDNGLQKLLELSGVVCDLEEKLSSDEVEEMTALIDEIMLDVYGVSIEDYEE